jgi:LysM repeat protein
MRSLLRASAPLSAAAITVALASLAAAPAAQAQTRDSVAASQLADSAKAPGTVLHTVKRGDTLWDIAASYLGDAFKWPELFRSNTSRVRNPHLIYPGQQLVIGPDGRPMFGPRPVASRAGGEPSGDSDVNQGVSMPRGVGQSRGPQQIALLENTREVGRTIRETVRPGEAETAPFLVSMRERDLREGHVVGRAEPSVVTAQERDQIQYFDVIDVILPDGAPGALGQRFTVYHDGPVLKASRQRVVHPVGIIELTAIGGGRAARAKVLTMWQPMRRHDRLVPSMAATLPGTVRPQSVRSEEEYAVAYIDGNVVLPTIQHHVVLSLTGDRKPKVGDQFALYEAGYYLGANLTDVSPDTDVAVISIVHVGAESATGVIVSHDHPAVATGMRARLIARMP